ncbi:MAG: hypothetical protein QM537_06725 [Candidatus Symbiobacter sp.]|nr:hypothetical protein [Candidatus Symbiobacter sp.]
MYSPVQITGPGIGLSTKELINRVSVWEKEKVKKDFHCNVCGEKSWAISSNIEYMPTVAPDNKSTDPVGFGQFVVLVCSNCGNSHSIMASFITGGNVTVKNPSEAA